MLTLPAAIMTGKIKEFVAHKEARGIGPADRKNRGHHQTVGDYNAAITRSNIAFVIARWFERKVNSPR
jgi:hypothetical protein